MSIRSVTVNPWERAQYPFKVRTVRTHPLSVIENVKMLILW